MLNALSLTVAVIAFFALLQVFQNFHFIHPTIMPPKRKAPLASMVSENNQGVSICDILQQEGLDLDLLERLHMVSPNIKMYSSLQGFIQRLQRPVTLSSFLLKDSSKLLNSIRVLSKQLPSSHYDCPIAFTDAPTESYSDPLFGEHTTVLWMPWSTKLIVLVNWMTAQGASSMVKPAWRAPGLLSHIDHSSSSEIPIIPLSLAPLLEIMQSPTMAITNMALERPKEGLCTGDWIHTGHLRSLRADGPVDSITSLKLDQFHILLYVFAALHLEGATRLLYHPQIYLGAMKFLVSGVQGTDATTFLPKEFDPVDLATIAVNHKEIYMMWGRISDKLIQLRRILSGGDEFHKMTSCMTETLFLMLHCPPQLDPTDELRASVELQPFPLIHVTLETAIHQLCRHMDIMALTQIRQFFAKSGLEHQLSCFIIPRALAISVERALCANSQPILAIDVQFSVISPIHTCTLLLANPQDIWNNLMRQSIMNVVTVRPNLAKETIQGCTDYTLAMHLVSMLGGKHQLHTSNESLDLLYAVVGLPPMDQEKQTRFYALLKQVKAMQSAAPMHQVDARLASTFVLFSGCGHFAISRHAVRQILCHKNVAPTFESDLPAIKAGIAADLHRPMMGFFQEIGESRSDFEASFDAKDYDLLTGNQMSKIFRFMGNVVTTTENVLLMQFWWRLASNIIPVFYTPESFGAQDVDAMHSLLRPCQSYTPMNRQSFDVITMTVSSKATVRPVPYLSADTPLRNILFSMYMVAFAGWSYQYPFAQEQMRRELASAVRVPVPFSNYNGMELNMTPTAHTNAVCSPLLVSLTRNQESPESLSGLMESFKKVMFNNKVEIAPLPQPVFPKQKQAPTTQSKPKRSKTQLELDLDCSSSSSDEEEEDFNKRVKQSALDWEIYRSTSENSNNPVSSL